MPFDPQGAMDRLSAQSSLNQRLLQVKTGKDALAQQYATGVRALDTQQTGRYRELLNNYAGRGMARSTGYANAYTEEQSDAAERRNQMDMANQQGLAQASVDESGAQADFLSNIGQILYGTTSRLAGNAGNLGMAGNTHLPVLLELARRRMAGENV
jgi:hypothetical protein